VSDVFDESAPSPSLFPDGDAQPIPANAIPEANNPLFFRKNLLLYFMIVFLDYIIEKRQSTIEKQMLSFSLSYNAHALSPFL
jgi:hypothetical protein